MVDEQNKRLLTVSPPALSVGVTRTGSDWLFSFGEWACWTGPNLYERQFGGAALMCYAPKLNHWNSRWTIMLNGNSPPSETSCMAKPTSLSRPTSFPTTKLLKPSNINFRLVFNDSAQNVVVIRGHNSVMRASRLDSLLKRGQAQDSTRSPTSNLRSVSQTWNSISVRN
jgi:hypothetical protein